jgi:hypothetical protein
VMEGSAAIAEVRGEAARDLKELFHLHSEMQNCLAVSITNVSQPSEPFYVTRVVPKKKGKRAIQ